MSARIDDLLARLIAGIESIGETPWQRPYRSADAPRNLDGRLYTGCNRLVLQVESHGKGYGPRWGTFASIKKHGGHVRLKEHGTEVVLMKSVNGKADDEGKRQAYTYCTTYRVFNENQCEGLPVIDEPSAPEAPGMNEAETAATQALVEYCARAGVDLTEASDAWYDSAKNQIGVPAKALFPRQADYVAVLAHECAHSTADALGRPRASGLHAYSREELVAEIAASLFCGISAVEPTPTNSAVYIAGWLTALKADPGALMFAAGRAERAVALISKPPENSEKTNRESSCYAALAG